MSPADPTPSHVLDLAWSSLEGNEPAITLDHLADFTEEPSNATEIEAIFGELILLQVLARLALGDLKGARSAMDIATTTVRSQPGPLQAELENDADLVRAEAEILLAEWRPEDACEAYLRLLDGAEDEEAAAYHQRLALCNDLLGDFETADAHMESARGLAPFQVTEDELDAIVDEARAALPETFQQALAQVAVVVEPMPTRSMAKSGGNLAETPPDLLGLFLGAPIGEPAAPGETPTCIRLFTRNLERICTTRAELVLEMQVTLYHELGHALGLDEAGVDAIGLA
ncbi:MAG: putative Zn-dependent protease with MMP-like domain [Bacteroidia bacterium]|jgi:predicted Zn-dependent protease with MMP-like domain